MAVAGERQTGVRIRLSMDLKGQGMTDVASMPWELMCPKDDSPLGASTQTALVRSLDILQPTQPTKYEPPLRIMALMSNPSGTAELNLDEERRKIEQNWASLDVEVDFVRPVTRQAIRKALAEPGADYHVLHFMGHGAFDAVKGGTLLLEHEDRSADPITGL